MERDGRGTEGRRDPWSDWLLEHRHGGNLEHRRRVLEAVERIADRVLDGAQLTTEMTLADIGTGEGLIAFRALARLGNSLHLVMTDFSAALLRHTENLAVERGVRDRCVFIEGSAEKLDGLTNGSVDVVTTRAVLAYVRDKRAALREFYRVLKSGGRISIAEPVFQDDAFEASGLRRMIEAQEAHPDMAFLRLLQRLKAAQFPSTEEQIWGNPLTNYSERDLVRMAREAGFGEIHMELHIDVRPSLITDWNVYINTSPHPLAPTIHRVMSGSFSEEERILFERILRPAIESRQSLSTDVIAYLTAVKSQATTAR
jgi:ubiquinone/menaquinone biosynthesis C-methylase UbiE